METKSEASEADAERSSSVHLGGRPWRPPCRTRRWRAAAISGSPMRPARACQSAAVKLERSPKWATTCCRGPPDLRPAKYHLSLAQKGFDPIARDLDLTPGVSLALELTLVPALEHTHVEVSGEGS